MSKNEWKETGKELGGAFTGFAKAMVRTAKAGVDKANDWAEDKPVDNTQESNVFNDGTWKETGKNLGDAFKGLGKTIVHTADEEKEKVKDWADDKKDANVKQEADEEVAQEKPAGYKFCPECGSETKGSKFCPNCGFKL